MLPTITPPTLGFWAAQLLRELGAPMTTQNMIALLAWAHGEGSRATFNPLATTQPWPGSTQFNSSNVRNYATFSQGMEATIKTLRNGYYGKILAALKAGTDAHKTAAAIIASPWGTRIVNLDAVSASVQVFANVQMAV